MKLHEHTPLIKSPKLSKACGREVLLKLDNLQPSGSFKIRGIGHLVQESIKSGKKTAVCSSGGNAGLAAAYACSASNLPCTVIIPKSTPSFAVDNVKEAGANVEVFGDYWDMADKEARSRITDDSVLYINPFDHPLIWEGHGSVIDELKTDLKEVKPSLIICSVGGGGLLLGILNGLKRNGWNDVPVLAMETFGAESLNEAVKANKTVVLDGIKSIAKSLGSTKVAEACLPAIKDHSGGVVSKVCHDTESIKAVELFLAQHRFFVEPACGASLAAIYDGYTNDLKLGDGPIIPIVCGGSAVSVEMIQTWKDNALS